MPTREVQVARLHQVPLLVEVAVDEVRAETPFLDLLALLVVV